MSAPTWVELSQHKLDYICTQGIEGWEYCRVIARHLRWEEQAGQWLVAGFIGIAFILASLVAAMVLADRRQRELGVPPRNAWAVSQRVGLA